MRMATPEERDRLCGFSTELFSRLERLKADGASLNDLVTHLRQSGVPMPAASVALRRIHAALDLPQARRAVELSAAYAKWPDYDEAFPESYKAQTTRQPDLGAMRERSAA